MKKKVKNKTIIGFYLYEGGGCQLKCSNGKVVTCSPPCSIEENKIYCNGKTIYC